MMTNTTSKQLADMWETFISCQNQYLDSTHNSTKQKHSNSSVYACSHTTKFSPDQELRSAGLDSRILSSYSEYHENETVTALELPPISSLNFDPNSTQFHEQIFKVGGYSLKFHKSAYHLFSVLISKRGFLLCNEENIR